MTYYHLHGRYYGNKEMRQVAGLASALAQFFRRWLARFPRVKVFAQDNAVTTQLRFPVIDEEPLARFLKSRKHFAPSTNQVKFAAFTPNREGQTSVFRHSGVPADELWDIGLQELPKDWKIYGAGIVQVSVVRAAGLEATPTGSHPLHADVVGWPTDKDPRLAKAAQVKVAIVIASQAKLLLRSQ